MKFLSISSTLILLGLFNNVNAGLFHNVYTSTDNALTSQIKQKNNLVQKTNTSNVNKDSINNNLNRDYLIAKINNLNNIGKHKEKEKLMDNLVKSMEPNEVVKINEYEWVRRIPDEEIKQEKEKRAREKKNRYNWESKNLSNVIESLKKSGATEELLKVADDNIENLFTFNKSNVSTKSINFSKVVNEYKELKDSLNSGNPLLNEVFLATYAVANCSKAKKMGLEYVFSYNKELDIWENYIVAKNNPKLKGFKYDLGIYYDKYEFVLNREVLKTK